MLLKRSFYILNNVHPRQTFTINNRGKTNKSFKITHIPAGTLLSLTKGTDFPIDGPVPLSNRSATVKFSQTSVRSNQAKQ